MYIIHVSMYIIMYMSIIYTAYPGLFLVLHISSSTNIAMITIANNPTLPAILPTIRPILTLRWGLVRPINV